jgi:hypothetical protein
MLQGCASVTKFPSDVLLLVLVGSLLVGTPVFTLAELCFLSTTFNFEVMFVKDHIENKCVAF